MRLTISAHEITGVNLIGKQSLAAVQELWDVWQIHCLILASLFLQVFLFLAASMRRLSTSRVLRTLLWLVFLSADAVAMFVLGHLAVHASRPGHQLMAFWAPFLLVHLGGQDTITAFSKQDNELWMRHLLSFVTQVGVAGYVVAKVPWPDRRLRDAMVLIFLSGCFKYAERILCLYLVSPPMLKSKSLDNLLGMLEKVHQAQDDEQSNASTFIDTAESDIAHTFSMMLEGWRWWGVFGSDCPCAEIVEDAAIVENIITDLLSADAPLNMMGAILAEDFVSDSGELTDFLSNAGRCRAYEYVAARLVDCYHSLYTKRPLRRPLCGVLCQFFCCCCLYPITTFCLNIFQLLCAFFRFVSMPMALVLFRAAVKEGQLLRNTSPADITVTYVLLVGALALDVSSAVISFYGDVTHSHRWSQELAQYSMIKRHTALREGSGMVASLRHCIGRRLGAWGVGLLELTQTPITQGHTPIKEFILDNLLGFAIRKEWNITSSRITVTYVLLVGALALDVSSAVISFYGDVTHSHRWSQELAQYSMIKRHAALREGSGMVASLRHCIGRRLGAWGVGLLELTQTPITQGHTPIKEFILDNLLGFSIRKEWNITSSRGQRALQMWMDRQQESGSDSTILPRKAVLDDSISADFPSSVLIWHIATDMCYYLEENTSTHSDQTKKNKQMSRELSNYIMYLVFKCGVMLTSQSQLVHDKAHAEISEILSAQQDRLGEKDAVRKLFDTPNTEANDHHLPSYWSNSYRQLLRSIEEALYSPVLPRAREVVQELIGIEDETERWALIASVWLHMLYYTAPRCGGAFHYEHLSTGGEFITHVLLLMYHLGPFLPTPGS